MSYKTVTVTLQIDGIFTVNGNLCTMIAPAGRERYAKPTVEKYAEKQREDTVQTYYYHFLPRKRKKKRKETLFE
jgi:hypothetical protein